MNRVTHTAIAEAVIGLALADVADAVTAELDRLVRPALEARIAAQDIAFMRPNDVMVFLRGEIGDAVRLLREHLVVAAQEGAVIVRVNLLEVPC